VRTLVISDLHLGSRSRHDVLRLTGARERLLEAIDGVDRLVLLGDILELATRHPRRAAGLAEPVIRMIGRRLGPDREVVVVPGNHDAPLARAWALTEGPRLHASTRVDPRASPALEVLLSWLAPARTRVSYPGVWLGERIWATHGHYLDKHLIPESAFGIRRGRLRGVSPATALPIEYEHRHRPVRRSRESLVARILARPVGTLLEEATHLLRLMTMPHVPRLMMNSGLAPVTATLIDAQMRHQSMPAMAYVARRLGIDADWVVFGHVHRRGPIDGEEWPARQGMQFLNTGSWVYEPLLVDRATAPHPYWPGGAVLLEEGRAPRSLGLLDDLAAEQLAPAPRSSAR
jgi:UDP-2,3-diacylglucosamine pyrophosphatase LpxH